MGSVLQESLYRTKVCIRTKIQCTRGGNAQMQSLCKGIKMHACACVCAELSL